MRSFLSLLFGDGSYRRLIKVMFLGAASGLSTALLIALVSRLFADSGSLEVRDLLQYSVYLALLVLLSLSLDLGAKWFLCRYGASRHRELHTTFSSIVLNDSLRQTEKTGMARLITIYAEDMSIVGQGLNTFANVGTSFFVVLGCLGYLAYVSFSLLCVTIIVGLLATVGYRRIHRESRRLAAEAFVYRDRHVSQFKDMVSGIGELKLNSKKRHQYFNDEYLPTVYEHEKRYVKFMLYHLFANAWVQLTVFSLLIAILLFIALTSFTTSVLGPFLVVVLFMRSHVSGLISAVPAWSRAGVALDRMREQGYMDLHRARVLNHADPQSVFGASEIQLSVEDLVWNYTSEVDDSTFQVGPLNVSMNSGELVFIVGHNGAGKTTFAKLLSGLYANESGRLLCNEIEVNESNRTSYNELFSLLLSDPFIFERLTIANNDNETSSNDDTAYAANIELDKSEQRIAYFLEKLQLHHKVSVSNQRLSSTSLSHGQRKRLALLAAYLEDKPVMIFDEWAENQDPRFKNVFYTELLPELKSRGKLVIVISHEAQFFHLADRVLKLDATATGATSVAEEVIQTDRQQLR